MSTRASTHGQPPSEPCVQPSPRGPQQRADRQGRAGRRSWGLFTLATAVGLWLGVTAPAISPVTPPAPSAQVQLIAPPPATDTA